MPHKRTFIGQRGPWTLFGLEANNGLRGEIDAWTLCELRHSDRWAFSLAANRGARSARLSLPHHQDHHEHRTPAEVCDLYTLLDESDDALSRFERDTLVSPQPTTQTNGDTHV